MQKRPTNKKLESEMSQIKAEHSYDCSDSIMDCIKEGRAKMRNRWLVLSEELGLKTSWILLLLIIIAVVNFDLFILSHGPQWEFMEFGTTGLEVAVKSFPYGWVAVGLILIVLAIYAMKSFSWSYIYPFKIFVIILVLGVFAVGGITFATGINDRLYMKLVEEPGAGSSFLGKMYCKLANRDIHSSYAMRGEVMSVDGQNIVIQTPSLDVVSIVLNDDTSIIDDVEIKKFDYIKLVGTYDDDRFIAQMIARNGETPGTMPIRRNNQDCVDKEEWERKQQVVELRRRAATQPLTPIQGTAEMIKSIY